MIAGGARVKASMEEGRYEETQRRLKMTTTLDVLRGARELIAKGWTQEVSARDRVGVPTLVSSIAAVSFCASGACERANLDAWPHNSADALGEALAALERDYDGYLVEYHNDNVIRSQTEALDWFDQAIADLEEA